MWELQVKCWARALCRSAHLEHPPGLLGGVIIWNGTGRPAASPLGPPSQRAGGVGSVWQLLAVFGNANPFSVLTKWPPPRRPGWEGDALGRVNTCCVCHLQGNIWEMPPLVPWTNALLLLQSCTRCNKLLLQGVY